MRWTASAANAWYDAQPFLRGANYVPSNAVNQLEMFQAETFDLARNERELSLAAALGLNVVRVFLHDLLWEQPGFPERLHQFLAIAERYQIRVIAVLFDSCWDPDPHAGTQRAPLPGVHNSRWVQSPGRARLTDLAAGPRLEAYVTGLIASLKDDPRILAWDVWNEPDNGWGAYAATEAPDKLAHVERLLPKAFAWARAACPTQPLTSALWAGDFANPSPIQRIQLAESDVLSFHNYELAASFLARIASLRPHGRPILCTEYMARQQGSTFAAILPMAQRERVAAIHWGLVAGKTQTWLPWDSWERPYIDREPAVWCHDVLYPDGSPYRLEEAALLKSLLR